MMCPDHVAEEAGGHNDPAPATVRRWRRGRGIDTLGLRQLGRECVGGLDTEKRIKKRI